MSKWEGLPYGPKRRLIEPDRSSRWRYVVALAAGALLIVGLLGNPFAGDQGGTPAATPVPTLRAAAAKPTSPAPTLAATAPPAPTALPTSGPVSLVVANTEGQGVFLRRTTSLGDRIKAWPERTKMVVVGEDQEVQGRRWRHVRDPDGNEGWVPAEYLVPAPATPAATPAGGR